MRALPIVSAVVLLMTAACADQPTGTASPGPKPPVEPPIPIGVYRIHIDGLGSSSMTSEIRPINPEGGANLAITPVGAGLVLEQVSSSSFTEGSRAAGAGGQRYVAFTYRIRNNTGGALNNVTFLMATTAASISQTPVTSLRRLDGSAASAAIAPLVVPTGAVALDGDLVGMRALYPDVLQVYTEGEVGAIALPAGVTGVFPYGYVVRNPSLASSRSLPYAADPNQFDGVLTVSFRLPLQPTGAQDVFGLSFDVLAVQDTETRLTETIEESQDTAGVRRARERATALGASTVTVLNGSPAADPFVTDYPGQRQLCGARTAGPVGAPTNTIVSPAAYTTIRLYRPGENRALCPAYFTAGTPDPANYGMEYTVAVRAMDRYGNIRTVPADTITFSSTDGTAIMPAPFALAGGLASPNVVFTTYGNSTLRSIGRRNRGAAPVFTNGMTRTWTGDVDTNWLTNGDWVQLMHPGIQDSVVIPGDRPNYPLLVANTTTRSVTMTDGSTTQPFINLSSFDFTINGSLAMGNNGTFTGTGRVILAGSTGTFGGGLSNVNMRNLRITGSYSATSNANVTGGRIVVQGGRLRSQGYRIRVRPS